MSHILLTNDDGIDAPGLAALRRGLDPLGTVLTLAPDGNRSAIARSITIDRPLHARETQFGGGYSGYVTRRHAGRLRAGGRPRLLRRAPARSSSPAPTWAPIWATTSPTRGPWPPPSKAPCWGCRRWRSPSQGRSPRHFDDAVTLVAPIVARVLADGLPPRPRAQRQRARPDGRRGARRAGHQPGLRQRSRTHRARDRRRHGQALHDPQRGARLPARDRHRFRGARGRVHLHHAAALRPGRPASVRAARGLEAERGRGGRPAGGRSSRRRRRARDDEEASG